MSSTRGENKSRSLSTDHSKLKQLHLLLLSSVHLHFITATAMTQGDVAIKEICQHL